MNSKERYLGSPLLLGHSKQESFKNIKDAFESRLSAWSGTAMSQAGRGTMVKHVLNSVPIYQMGTFKLPSKLLQQLTSIERKFFWGYNNNSGSNPIAWLNLCRPMDFGGLAFSDLEKLNLAMLTKIAWKICTESDSLLTKVLSSKYFKSGDILHQNINAKNCSYVWNGISKGLQIVQKHFFMEINNGLKTKIWKDRWIPSLTHPPLPKNDLFRFYENVAELFLQGTEQWNVCLLDNLFDQDTSQKIEALFIDNSKEDAMIWMPAKDGNCSVKSTYKKLALNEMEVQTNGVTVGKKVWKFLWRCKAAHRIKLFVWKCIREINCTKLRRAMYDHTQDTVCEICGRENESMEHLIFDCTHARAVCGLLNVNINAVRQNFHTVSEWMISWFSTDQASSAEFTFYTIMIASWVIWKDRCDLIFQGVSLNPTKSVNKVKYHRMSHLHTDNSILCSDTNTMHSSCWKPPLQGFLKFNVDASFDMDTKEFGTGTFIRDFSGTCLGIKGSYRNGALGAEAAECMEIREALSWAKRLQYQSIQIEGDAKLVKQSICSQSLLIQWENMNLIKEIKQLISSFTSCTFEFISRDDNQVANVVSRNTRETKQGCENYSNFSHNICNFLAGDINTPT